MKSNIRSIFQSTIGKTFLITSQPIEDKTLYLEFHIIDQIDSKMLSRLILMDLKIMRCFDHKRKEYTLIDPKESFRSHMESLGRQAYQNIYIYEI